MRKDNQIYCNCCGKVISQDTQNPEADFLSVEKTWGYFSGKDGERHSFDLCETCYDRIRKEFVLEVEILEKTELV